MRLTIQDLYYESVTGLKLDSLFIDTATKVATVSWESEDRFYRRNWELVDWKAEDGINIFNLKNESGINLSLMVEPSGKVQIENIKIPAP